MSEPKYVEIARITKEVRRMASLTGKEFKLDPRKVRDFPATKSSTENKYEQP